MSGKPKGSSNNDKNDNGDDDKKPSAVPLFASGRAASSEKQGASSFGSKYRNFMEEHGKPHSSKEPELKFRTPSTQASSKDGSQAPAIKPHDLGGLILSMNHNAESPSVLDAAGSLASLKQLNGNYHPKVSDTSSRKATSGVKAAPHIMNKSAPAKLPSQPHNPHYSRRGKGKNTRMRQAIPIPNFTNVPHCSYAPSKAVKDRYQHARNSVELEVLHEKRQGLDQDPVRRVRKHIIDSQAEVAPQMVPMYQEGVMSLPTGSRSVDRSAVPIEETDDAGHGKWLDEKSAEENRKRKHVMSHASASKGAVDSFLGDSEKIGDRPRMKNPYLPSTAKQKKRAEQQKKRAEIIRAEIIVAQELVLAKAKENAEAKANGHTLASNQPAARAPARDPDVQILTETEYKAHCEQRRKISSLKKKRKGELRPVVCVPNNPAPRPSAKRSIRDYQYSPSYPGVDDYINDGPSTVERNNRHAAVMGTDRDSLADEGATPHYNSIQVNRTDKKYHKMVEEFAHSTKKEKQRLRRTVVCNHAFGVVYDDFRGRAVADMDFTPKQWQDMELWFYFGCGIPEKGQPWHPTHCGPGKQRDILLKTLDYPHPNDIGHQKLKAWVATFEQACSFDDFLDRYIYHFTTTYGNGPKHDWTTTEGYEEELEEWGN